MRTVLPGCHLCSLPLYKAIALSYFAATLVLFLVFVYGQRPYDHYAIQFFADSLTYMSLWEAGELTDWFDFVGIGHNFLGPWLILSAVDGNLIGVFLINSALFFASLYIVFRAFSINRALFVLAICLNPITLSSLLLVNKEIIALFSMLSFVAYVNVRRAHWLIMSLIIGSIARWEMGLFLLAAWLLVLSLRFFKRPRLLLLASLGVLTIAGLALDDLLHRIFENAEFGAEGNEGTGVYSWFNAVQREYGYVWVAVPKMLHLAFGLLWRIDRITDWEDVYNNVVVMGFVISFAGLALIIIFQKRARLNDPVVFVAIIYWMFISFTPIYAPRYLYPLYALFAIIAFSRVGHIVTPRTEAKRNASIPLRQS